MRNVCDAVVEVLRSRSAEVPLNLEEILSHVIVLGALDRSRPHDTSEISGALMAEMTRRAETHLPQRFTTTDGVWWALVDPPPTRLRPVGRGWMAQLLRDMRWRSTTSIGARLESFRYDGSSATALLRASRQHDENDVTLDGQIEGHLVVPRLRGGVTISADVDGDVVVDGPVAGDVTITGQVAGSVLVRGSVDGTVRVASTVQRSVRINAKHVGRIVIEGQVGGALHLEARVIDGLTVSGWVADDVTFEGNVAGGVRVAADISGRLSISKRMMGNVKIGGWIIGGIDVSGQVEGELAISAWVGGPVSITAPVGAVNLGSGRFHGTIKIRPEQTGGARTSLTSVRLAEFHAPVRVHCDVDTTAVDTAGVVGQSQLKCVGSKRRSSGRDTRGPHTLAPSQTPPRSAHPIRLQPSEPAVITSPKPPALTLSKPTPSAPSVPGVTVVPERPQPTRTAAELLPSLPRPAQPGQRLPAADCRLTLAELAQAQPTEPAHEPAQSVADLTPPRSFDQPISTPGTHRDIAPIGPAKPTPAKSRTLADIPPMPADEHPIDTSQTIVDGAPPPVVETPVQASLPYTTAIPTQPTTAAVPVPPTCTQVIPTQSETSVTPRPPMLTQPVPTQLQLMEPPSATPTTLTQQIPVPAAAPEHDVGATRQLVLGIAWLS